MSARRFFVDIAPDDVHKILHVLRLRDGDSVEIVDGGGNSYDARLSVEDRSVRAELLGVRAQRSIAALHVDVAQGIPKGAKMDFVVEKATELGATAVLPLYAERGVVRDVGDGKLERWRRLAKTAAAQSERLDVPAIGDPLTFDALLERFDDYDLVLMPWERAAEPLRDALENGVPEAGRVLLLVGPEGGFSEAEAARARDRGARLVSLGGRILRTETAALAVLAVLGYVADTF